jgi:hypothetical protein
MKKKPRNDDCVVFCPQADQLYLRSTKVVGKLCR